MLRNREEFRQFLYCALWLLALTAAMVGVFALLGRFSVGVLLGALFGYFMSAGNLFALTVVVSNAADRAQETGNVAEAQGMIRAAAPIRLIALLVLYILVLRFTSVDRIAAILPLLLMQAVIWLMGFFKKDGVGR